MAKVQLHFSIPNSWSKNTKKCLKNAERKCPTKKCSVSFRGQAEMAGFAFLGI